MSNLPGTMQGLCLVVVGGFVSSNGPNHFEKTDKRSGETMGRVAVKVEGRGALPIEIAVDCTEPSRDAEGRVKKDREGNVVMVPNPLAAELEALKPDQEVVFACKLKSGVKDNRPWQIYEPIRMVPVETAVKVFGGLLAPRAKAAA